MNKRINLILILFTFIFSIINPLNFVYIIDAKTENFYEKQILITGFESWGKYTPNPSQLIVETLDGEIINNVKIIGIVAPVIWGDAVDKICQEINLSIPEIVISKNLTRKEGIEYARKEWNAPTYPSKSISVLHKKSKTKDVMAFDENQDSHIDRAQVNWKKMIERNITNKYKVICEAMDWDFIRTNQLIFEN